MALGFLPIDQKAIGLNPGRSKEVLELLSKK